MRKKIAIILTIAMLLPMIVMIAPAYADYASYTTRLSGATRVETAVAVSKKQHPTIGGASAVVLARKDAFPDALAGGVLADAKSAPILLTSSISLDAATKDEINRCLNYAPKTVYILGGTGAISADVESEVKALDSDYTVTRISGADRYETAVEIAKAAHAAPTTYLIATGENFPDALAAAAAGAKYDFPVLLVTKDSIPTATKDLILSDEGRDVKLIIVGGTGVVSDTVVSELAGLTSGTIKRVSGADRYATAVEVAKHADLWNRAAANIASTWSVARGDDFADALAGAILGRPLLLTNTSDFNATTESYLKTIFPKSTDVSTGNVYVLGGTGAIINSVERLIAIRVSGENWGTPIAAPGIYSVNGGIGATTNSPAGPSSDTAPDVKVLHDAVKAAGIMTLYDATGADLVKLATIATVVDAASTTITSFATALSTDGTYALKVKIVDKYGNESPLSAGFSYTLDTTKPYPTGIALADGNGTLANDDKMTITFNETIDPSTVLAGGISDGVFSTLGTFATVGSNTGSYAATIDATHKIVTITLTITLGASDTPFSGEFTFTSGINTITDAAGNLVVDNATCTQTGIW
ncbi:cell wall-binding repeat-containing protein [Candidatus Oleimmundimicrobium sp.]|uniref:cell wall-binding repeat-containing protein n=1 Tax=Candidatus Oleimmundimicrobium sp. TaxID=3060597 RepID=UPI002721A741|nr:cell wall-binding repeat-containing protein [Candidatus Oleimmundimicrobium sp.]MDO8885557.1 cell wall-binding repeat-containing protein [Candidatus Oleimmundimicrobium sp.]